MTLTEAIEDYDLALARLDWVMACCCQRTTVQDDARRWHVSEVLAANERLSEAQAMEGRR